MGSESSEQDGKGSKSSQNHLLLKDHGSETTETETFSSPKAFCEKLRLIAAEETIHHGSVPPGHLPTSLCPSSRCDKNWVSKSNRRALASGTNEVDLMLA
jgi:hypothetical protein